MIGTRPEAIKLAPVIKELKRRQAVAPFSDLQVDIVLTGQHKEILYTALDDFAIKPDIDLALMTQNQSLSGLTARLLEGVDQYLDEHAPDWVIAQGDTTTVMASSLAAFYQRIRFAHVEAGLRSHDLYRPFPEEVNRKIAAITATLHFAPTEDARKNLLQEGIGHKKIMVVGNTIVDAVQEISRLFSGGQANSSLEQECLQKKRLILLTCHRRESFGKPLQNICKAIKAVAASHEDCRIVFPVHPNPNVRSVVFQELAGIDGIVLTEPLRYAPFVNLMRESSAIITDSGGIQEEATTLNKPLLILRDETERPEALQGCYARLIGTETMNIVHAVNEVLKDPKSSGGMAHYANPFGDGKASLRICEAIINAQ